MEIDFSQCHVRTPAGDDLTSLFQMLMEVFVPDRPIFSEMIATGKQFYTWTPCTLYQGDELLGNVSLFPMRIWLEGRVVETVGIASVATQKKYRRQGVARYLMEHCLKRVDRQEKACVLFTDLPAVYESLGFRTVRQSYRAAATRRMPFGLHGYACEYLDTLAQEHLDRITPIYSNELPNYNGKVVRDPDYWQSYQMLFNNDRRARLALCSGKSRMEGYARFDDEGDRLTICELCCRASATNMAEALLACVARYARKVPIDLITFALPPDHFAWRVLESGDVGLEPEPPGAGREEFMVRPAAGQPLGPLGRLQWSLADRF